MAKDPLDALLSPQVRKLQKLTQPKTERRKSGRIALDELNAMSEADLKQRLPSVMEDSDSRPVYMKVLDVLDVPRNLIGNAIGSLVGVDKSRLEKGTFGVRKVSMSDVLGKLGVKGGPAKAILGFVGDIAIDPLTYMSLGATTGLKVAKGAPKMYKATAKALQAASRGEEVAGVGKALLRVPSRMAASKVKTAAGEVARPGAFQRLANIRKVAGPKVAGEIQALKAAGKSIPADLAARNLSLKQSLMGKKGGVLSDILAKRASMPSGGGKSALDKMVSARRFLQEGGEKGRTIARLPFANKGIEVPLGQAAKISREMTDPRAIESLMAIGKEVSTARLNKVRSLAAGAQAAALAGKVKTAAENLAAINKEVESIRAKYQSLRAAVSSAKQQGLSEGVTKAVTTTPEIRAAKRELDVATGIHQRVKELLSKKDAAGELSAKFDVSPKASAAIQRAMKRPVPPAAKGAFRQSQKRMMTARKALAQAAKGAPSKMTAPADAIGGPARTPLMGIAKLAKAEGKAKLTAAKSAAEAVPGLRQAAKEADEAAQLALGKARNMANAADAPLSVRLGQVQELGALPASSLPGRTPLERLKQAATGIKQGMFGPGDSTLRRQELGIMSRMTAGRQQAGLRASAQMRQMLDPVIDEMRRTMGMSKSQAKKTLVSLIEGAGRVDNYHPSDPGLLRYLKAKSDLAELSNTPATKGTADRIDALIERFSQGRKAEYDMMAARGVQPAELPNSMSRVARKKFARAAQRQEQRMGPKSWTSPRVQRVDFQMPDGSIRTELSSQADMLKDAAAKGGKEIGRWDITTEQFNAWGKSGTGPGRGVAGPDYIGKQFDSDLAKSAASDAMRREVALAAADTRDLAQKYAIKIDRNTVASDLKGLAPAKLNEKSPLYGIIGPELQQYVYPPQVAEMLTRLFDVSASADDMGRLLKAWDTAFGYWKSIALFHPSYVGRNVFQNLFGSLMAGGNPVNYVRRSIEMRKLLKAADSGQDVSKIVLRLGGQAWRGDEFLDFARANNMLDSGKISQFAAPRGGVEKLAGKAQGVHQSIYRANAAFENSQRLGLIADFLDQGMHPNQAVQATLRGMPDLTDLTKFERTYATRIFPWYRWMRHNAALQLFDFLPNTPAWMALSPKVKRAIEGMRGSENVPEELRPEWLREAGGIQITGDKQGGQTFLLNSWLPFQEPARLLGGAMDLREPADMAMQQLRPEAKFVAEMGMGTDMLRRDPVEALSLPKAVSRIPQAIVGASGTPLDNILAARPLREVRRVAEQPTTASRLMRAAIGGSTYPVDRERGLKAEAVQLRGQAQLIRQQINRAMQVNDNARAKALANQWMSIMRRLHELDLQGVPKATADMLEQAGVAAGGKL